MANNIEGKVVVITGASSGLGAATARRLANEGARRTIISPGAVATELTDSITEPDVAKGIRDFYAAYALPADSFANIVAFAISQPPDVDINEILFRPTRQEL